MFTHSTACLQGCLPYRSAIYGRYGCLLGAHFQNASKLARAAFHDSRTLSQDTTDSNAQHVSPAFSSSSSSPNTWSNKTAPTVIQESDASAPINPEALSPVALTGNSTYQRVKVMTPEQQLDQQERHWGSVTSHSKVIFGSKDRVSSARLVARKRTGPHQRFDLEPARMRASNSTRWRNPPIWKSVYHDPVIDKGTISREFERQWVHRYQGLFELSRDGTLEEARKKFDVYRQVALTFVSERDLEELRGLWDDLPSRDRLHLASILLGCLVDSPRRTLLMLSLDIELSSSDWKRRCECLCYLDMMHLKEIESDTHLKEMFAQQIARVSQIWSWPADLVLNWHFLVLLLRHNGPEHCENITDTILEVLDEVPTRTILIMVDHFTKIGNADRALALFSRIPPEEREKHKVRILDRYANLISIDTIEKSDSVGNFKALPALIGLGLPLDNKAHNRIIERALDLGVPDVAWDVFRFMEARDVSVSANSHLRLLKNSFEQSNREKLDAMMSAVHGRKDLYQYPYLVAYMMHIVRVVCKIDRKLPTASAVSHLLAVYDRAYDRGPLVKLGIVEALPVEHTLQERLEQPPPAVLGFTIWAYVLCQRDERLVSALWFRVIHMIKQQEESALECAQHDIMWNGFIHFYAQSRVYLRKAVDVVEAMIEHNLCMPTERSWSEVLCGFLKHGEEETAGKIWQMMLARNVYPTQKGWAFLLEKNDKTQVAEMVKYVLDERIMPAGIDETLSWSKAATATATATGKPLTEASATQRVSSRSSENTDQNEVLGNEAFEENNADSALADANFMYQ